MRLYVVDYCCACTCAHDSARYYRMQVFVDLELDNVIDIAQ